MYEVQGGWDLSCPHGGLDVDATLSRLLESLSPGWSRVGQRGQRGRVHLPLVHWALLVQMLGRLARTADRPYTPYRASDGGYLVLRSPPTEPGQPSPYV